MYKVVCHTVASSLLSFVFFTLFLFFTKEVLAIYLSIAMTLVIDYAYLRKLKRPIFRIAIASALALGIIFIVFTSYTASNLTLFFGIALSYGIAYTYLRVAKVKNASGKALISIIVALVLFYGSCAALVCSIAPALSNM